MKWRMVVTGWTVRVLMLGCLLLMGCATSERTEVEGDIKNGSMVVGFIHVEPKGPYFRRHQAEAQVQFFDVKNTETGKITRVSMGEKAKRFVTRLSPGHYHLLRIQISEGPFRSECYTKMNFDVLPDNTMYLGMWRVQVDAPKTVRMLQVDVFREVLERDHLLALHPGLGEKPLAISPPRPETNQSRLFAVAPSQPRAKYFYRR